MVSVFKQLTRIHKDIETMHLQEVKISSVTTVTTNDART